MADVKYISRQIAVSKNNNGLIEFNNYMNPAPVEFYGHVHAYNSVNAAGQKMYSRIGVVIQDYSKGTGDNCIRVKANLEPKELKFLHAISCKFPSGFTYPLPTRKVKAPYQTKIFGNADDKGLCPVTKFKVTRTAKDDKGEPMEQCWRVEIINGKGIKIGTKTGGSYMKGDSFIETARASINLSETDYFSLISDVYTFINLWEMSYGIPLIKQADKEMKAYAEYQRQMQQAS